MSIWDWAPGPPFPLPHFSDDGALLLLECPGKVYFERSHRTAAFFVLSSLLDMNWAQGRVLLPSQLRRCGFSLQPCCWEEENPPGPRLGDGERRDKEEQLFVERCLLGGASGSTRLLVSVVPLPAHPWTGTRQGATLEKAT